MNEKKKRGNWLKGFTLVEMLLVVTIIIIIVLLGAGTWSRYIPVRRFGVFGRQVLSDIRFAAFKAVAEDEPYVWEGIGTYRNPYPGNSSIFIDDLYRLWKLSDWVKYFHNRCRVDWPEAQPVVTHKQGFPVPLMVYDTTPAGPLNQICGDENINAVSAAEIPLPFLEVVKKGYVDPPQVASDPDWIRIRRLSRLNRQAKIPEDVNLLTPVTNPNTMEGIYIVFYPTGWAAGYRYTMRTNPIQPGYMNKPDDERLDSGLLEVGLLLDKTAVLSGRYLADVEWNVGPGGQKTTIKPNPIIAQRYCFQHSYARGIQMLLHSGQTGFLRRTPSDFSIPMSVNSSCVLDGSRWR